MKYTIIILSFLLMMPSLGHAERYLGNLGNKYKSDSINNPYSTYGSRYGNGVRNPYSTYGSKYSSKSATNPYTYDAPKVYDRQGNYKGKLSSNPYDSDSINNPYNSRVNRYEDKSDWIIIGK